VKGAVGDDTRLGATTADDDGGRPPALQLRAGGVGLLITTVGPLQPEILYWGEDLAASVEDLGAVEVSLCAPIAHAVQDLPIRRGLIPEASGGYRPRPGLLGFRRGRSVAPQLRQESIQRDPADAAGTERLTVTSTDADAGLAARTELVLDGHGVLRVRHRVTNIGPDAFELTELTVALPLPSAAQEIADFTGKWSGERAQQRLPLRFGSWTRENRRGRTSANSSYLTMVGTPGFRHRDGRVWAMHVAWSGNQVTRIDADPDGTRMLVGGEMLEPGEITLGPGESYCTPWVFAVYSNAGIDGVSSRLHRSVRARPHHPHAARPVVLNTWEAVYFDRDLPRLLRLAEAAAAVGVERFVLDDGWFGDRRDDTTSLGDWVESPGAWPGGLGSLSRRVQELGMQFGLWVEPEMVSPQSELYRQHPDWVLADPRRLPVVARHQYVLDLARPEVSDYLFATIDALVKRYGLAVLKWDHNRDVVLPVRAGRAGVHRQTVAVYRLLDRLRAANPGLEIESCASGGARVDLGILQRTDRVWASDCNDALERQAIQRGTRVLLPLELIGCHIGPPRSHTTSRIHDLSFRAATALFGHLGIEWDIASAHEDDRTALAAVIATYRRLRSLLHTGDLVTADHPDPSASVFGVVSQDRTHAVFCYAQLEMSRFEVPPPATFPGLDANQRYCVRSVAPAGAPRVRQRVGVPWMSRDEFRIGGAALARTGLAIPVLEPEQALVLEFRAVAESATC
jgi:alpha-galactosidase